jgi:hypothetical protein
MNTDILYWARHSQISRYIDSGLDRNWVYREKLRAALKKNTVLTVKKKKEVRNQSFQNEYLSLQVSRI